MARKKITYTEDLYRVVENLALAGNNQEEIAQVLGITGGTFSQHIAGDARLKQIVTTAVKKVVGEITATVIRKALGFTHTTKVLDRTGKLVEVEKYFPPDMLAASIYLNNRDADKWKLKREDAGDDKNKLVIHVTLDGENAKLLTEGKGKKQSKKSKEIQEAEEADFIMEDGKEIKEDAG